MKILFALAALSLVACQAEKVEESSLSASEAAAASVQVPVSAARSLAAGRYLISVEMTGSCLDATVNVKQNYEYPNSNSSRVPTVTLEADGKETDNLRRTRICRSPTLDTGKAIVELTADAKVRVKGFGAKITKIEKIEKTTSVSMAHLGDLFAGEYVLGVSVPMGCTPSVFTSKKHSEIGEGGRRLDLSFGSNIGDNLIRPMVCVAPGINATDSGSVYHESAGGLLKIVGKDSLKIKKIERITKKTAL